MSKSNLKLRVGSLIIRHYPLTRIIVYEINADKNGDYELKFYYDSGRKGRMKYSTISRLFGNSLFCFTVEVF